MNFTDNVSKIPGVGPSRTAILRRLDIHTIGDLLNHFPRDYQDRSVITPIGNLEPCPFACIKARVTETPKALVRRSLTLVTVKASDVTGSLNLVWYNQPYLQKSLKPGEYLFCGPVSSFSGSQSDGFLQMENPEYETLSDNAVSGKKPLTGERIVPIYPLTEGLSQKVLRKLLWDALDSLSNFEDNSPLPESVVKTHGLISRRDALFNIHYPDNQEAFLAARRTLVFTELFHLQLNLLRTRGFLRKTPGMVFENKAIGLFEESLPFSFTDAQKRVLNEILVDMSSGKVMNRLIQGDVGSGKTAVAMAAMYIAAKNHKQAAIMAPTETLARQHHLSIEKTFAPLGLKTALLAGSLPQREKAAVRDKLARGEIDVAVGTHALIMEQTAFARLGLVICDEQHRFGVRQRGALGAKGLFPHYLIMTATPIPRTLAMILYGDMDISIIDQLPPGRKTISTSCVDSRYRSRIFNFIKKQAEEGRQTFIICPLIEENDSGLKDVKTYTVGVTKATGLKTAVMHGRLPQEEKTGVMDAFASGETQVLVSTTVIEVGIDVPNATVMLIENAERFGLAQLHQLRGRVGRGPWQSYCILVTDAPSPLTKERMKAMTSKADGFALADLDLKIRGPGDFFGTRQHGLPNLAIANLYRDGFILKEAQEAAREYMKQIQT